MIVTGDIETILVRDLKPFGIPTYKKARNTGRGSYRRKDNRYPERTQTGNLLD